MEFLDTPDMTDEAGPDAKRPGKRRGPGKATRRHLENAALRYLARFAASAQQLRSVLMRRVIRSATAHGTDAVEGEAWVDDILARYRRSGLLNDQDLSKTRARSLNARGAGERAIRFKLKAQGFDDGAVSEAIDSLRGEMPEPDLNAAVSLARRRGLGPYRADQAGRREKRDKDLAALARAGFDYDTARRVVEAGTPENAEALIEE